MSASRQGQKHRAAGGSQTLNRTAKIVVALVLGAVIVSWVMGVIAARSNVSVEKRLMAYDINLAAGVSDPLPNGLSSGAPFPRYSVSSGAQPMGDVCVVDVPNNTGRGWLQQIVLKKPVLEVGVYIDRSLVIRQCWLMQPARPVLAPGVAAMAESYAGSTVFDVLLGGGPAVGADEAMGSAMRSAIRDVCASVFIEQRGIDEYRRFVAVHDVVTLGVGKPFPPFVTTTIEGKPIGSTLLKGRKTLIVATNPPCASCFETTVAIMKRAEQLSKGKWNLVLLVLADKDADSTKALIAAVPAGVLVIADPLYRLASAIYMLHSPYVATINAGGVVTYYGSGYETVPVMAALQGLADLSGGTD